MTTLLCARAATRRLGEPDVRAHLCVGCAGFTQGRRLRGQSWRRAECGAERGGAERNLSIRQVTASGCPPAVGIVTEDRPECDKYVDAMLRALVEAPPSKIVIVAYYFHWMRGDNGGKFLEGEPPMRSAPCAMQVIP